MSKYFDGITTMSALKAEYKRLVKINHPDCGGDEAAMKAINLAYEEAVNWIKQYGDEAERAKATSDVPADYIRVINAVIACPGLIVEIVGSWVWCTGNTYANRAALKAAGYRYAAKKQAWYWHSPDDAPGRRSRMSLDQIKDKYGAQTIKATRSQAAITA